MFDVYSNNMIYSDCFVGHSWFFQWSTYTMYFLKSSSCTSSCKSKIDYGTLSHAVARQIWSVRPSPMLDHPRKSHCRWKGLWAGQAGRVVDVPRSSRHFIRKDQKHRTRLVMTLLGMFTTIWYYLFVSSSSLVNHLLRVRFSMGLTPSLSGVSTWNCWFAEVIEVPKDPIARMQTLLMIYNDLVFASWKWLVDLQVHTKCTNSMQIYNNHLGPPYPHAKYANYTDLHISPQISQAAEHSQAA